MVYTLFPSSLTLEPPPPTSSYLLLPPPISSYLLPPPLLNRDLPPEYELLEGDVFYFAGEFVNAEYYAEVGS